MIRRVVTFVLLCLVLSLNWLQATAQTGAGETTEHRYYPQTGHSVAGLFLRTYLSVPDPVQIFGYPITEPFQEQFQGRLVQYFERARFELLPDNPEETRVLISALGRLMQVKGSPLNVPANFPACRSFQESEFVVCYAFRDFFEANGGAMIFGFPISNFEIVDSRIVQYFQRARFEWHPELPAGQRVQITNLGRQYFRKMLEDPARLLPLPLDPAGNNRMQSVFSIRVRAFPRLPVTAPQAEQSIDIIVQDQNLQAISNAEVELVIQLSDGAQQRIIVPASTGRHGVVSYTFSYKDLPVGTASVRVTATFETLSASTITSFRIWY